jgi:glycerophosphoryl diester phosphodiesterase
MMRSVFFLCGVVLLLSCKARQKAVVSPVTDSLPPKQISMSFDKQGHRGCRGLMPENTIPAMLSALQLGVTTLEMDVVISKDQQVVVSHEAFFNHDIATKPDGSYVSEAEEKQLNIYKMDYTEVQRYDVGLKPHPRFPQQEKMRAVKPLLGALIDSVKEYMRMARRPFPFFNIETKTNALTDGIFHPAPEVFVDLLMQVVKEKDVARYVIIQSFDVRTLQVIHRKYPQVRTALLINSDNKFSLEQNLEKLGFTPSVYSPNYMLVNKLLLEECRAKGMQLIPWTVNEAADIKRMKELGVDGLISDYPDRL